MVSEQVPSLELCVSGKCEGRADGCRTADNPLIMNKREKIKCRRGLHQETVQTKSTGFYVAGLGCKRTRSMQFTWDNCGLSAHEPTKGIREWRKPDLGPMTRIAEETRRKLACYGHLQAFGPSSGVNLVRSLRGHESGRRNFRFQSKKIPIFGQKF